jgi:hypothetical protein
MGSAITYRYKLNYPFNFYQNKFFKSILNNIDFLVENLGFAGWIQTGTWKSNGQTTQKHHAPTVANQGGWAGLKNISMSAYWSLDNQWLYMMGDSTMRQVWATFVSPFQNNDFERNAKEWTRENCARQYPHRKEHPPNGYFPEEGWGGKCGNNEVTCDFAGFGPEGKITFDWKHFPLEDYDEWLFGDGGKFATNSTRIPDILVVQLGLHTCFHAFNAQPWNETMIINHSEDIKKYMLLVRQAIDKITSSTQSKVTVIMVTAGRIGNPDPKLDHCIWKLNRITAVEAHMQGFVVLEREEIERRLLFKSEFSNFKTMKTALHLENPAPQIVGTSLLNLIGCLRKNDTSTDYFNEALSKTKWGFT